MKILDHQQNPPDLTSTMMMILKVVELLSQPVQSKSRVEEARKLNHQINISNINYTSK